MLAVLEPHEAAQACAIAEYFLLLHYPEEVDLPVKMAPILLSSANLTSLSAAGVRDLVLAGLGLPFAERSLELVAPIVLLTVTAVMTELRARLCTPELDPLRSAIRAAARSLGAGEALADNLAMSVAPELLKLWLEQDCVEARSRGNAVGPLALPAAMWVVDWNMNGTETIERATVQRSEALTPAQVHERYRVRKSEFGLYVDTTERSILLQGSGFEDKPLRDRTTTVIPWMVLKPRHERLLNMVLDVLYTRRTISYDAVLKALHPGRRQDGTDNSVRRTRSELDSLLGGLVARVLETQRGSRCYRVKAIPSYCWVRPVA